MKDDIHILRYDEIQLIDFGITLLTLLVSCKAACGHLMMENKKGAATLITIMSN